MKTYLVGSSNLIKMESEIKRIFEDCISVYYEVKVTDFATIKRNDVIKKAKKRALKKYGLNADDNRYKDVFESVASEFVFFDELLPTPEKNQFLKW